MQLYLLSVCSPHLDKLKGEPLVEDSVDLSSPRQLGHLLRGTSADAVVEINSEVLHKTVGK